MPRPEALWASWSTDMPLGLFKHKDDAGKQAEAEAQARQQKDLALLAQGQLPSRAQERLAQQEQGGTWSSDLSVDELLAIRSSGFEPAGQVMGASVYHLGWQQRCNGGNQFMSTYTHALYSARQMALSRMAQEAAGLGGQGVVGVRFGLRNLGDPGDSRTIEFTALGTAIRRTSAPPLPRPFTSSVSGQEFAKLLAAGYVPMALVIAVSALLIHTGWSTQRQMGWFSGNQEVDLYTQAVTAARHQAMSDLRKHLSEAGADGSVGSTVGFTVHPRECTWQEHKEDHLVEFLALGTAVARFSDVAAGHPVMAIRLDEQPAASATLE